MKHEKLTDALSELDPGPQDFVLNQIVSGQVYITCCQPGRLTKLGNTIETENGKVSCKLSQTSTLQNGKLDSRK